MSTQKIPGLITGLFKFFAASECEIEKKRSELDLNESSQRALFDYFNYSKDGRVSLGEILKVLTDNNVTGFTIDDCRAIVEEFDSTQEGCLEFEEFINIFTTQGHEIMNSDFQERKAKHPMSAKELPKPTIDLALSILKKEQEL